MIELGPETISLLKFVFGGIFLLVFMWIMDQN